MLATFVAAFLVMADSALEFRPKNIFTVTGDFFERPYPDFWERVDRLSELGHFFGEVIPEEATIASPEEATIMYHSEHRMMGLLGISTPMVARAPLQPMTTADILHRRRAGPAIAAITTGGFVVELIFTIPGLGRYFVTAVQQLDYTVIMGTTVFYGAFLVVMVLLVDIIYGLVDPRIRLQGKGGQGA